MKKEILAIIPARGSKDEIEHMNIRDLGGHPLIYYTIKAALNSEYINRVIVSTEDIAIKEISLKNGAQVPFLRPEYLCNGDITIADVVSFTLDKLKKTEDYDCDIVVILLPNTPFKTSGDIDKMIEYLNENNFDSVIPLRKMSGFFWKNDVNNNIHPLNFEYRKKRIDAEPLYIEEGGIYVYNKRIFSEPDKLRLGKKISYYFINKHHAQTIQNVYDLYIFERLIKLPVSLIDVLMHHE